MYREIKAASLRQHDRRNDAIYLAWQVERIRLSTKRTQSGKKTSQKIVALKKVLLPEPTEKKEQTVSEMRGALAVLSAQYGIPLRQVSG